MSKTRSISEVAPSTLRITSGVANFYALEESGRVTLVDAGTPGDWNLLLQALSIRGLTVDDVDAVLLTHAHADHTGFAERARTEVDATIWVDHHDEEVAKGAKPSKNDGAMTRYILRREFYKTLFSLTRRGGASIVPIAEVSAFKDGETIDAPCRPRAVHAPGHTPGNSALLMERQRVLLSGDTLITRNPLTGRVGPQIMPSGFNQDTAEALQSLDALSGLGADTILPGHGEPWVESVDEAVQLAQVAGPS
jgi:glyoxylase-like metal-dependent hydrolase (beta-lactamase superfamily II)